MDTLRILVHQEIIVCLNCVYFVWWKKKFSIFFFLFFLAQSETQTLHVHLPNHGFRMLRFDEASDVRQIINLIVNSMAPGQKTNPQSYALRLRHMLTKEVRIVFVSKFQAESKWFFFLSFVVRVDNMDAARYVNVSSNGTYIEPFVLEHRLSQCR